MGLAKGTKQLLHLFIVNANAGVVDLKLDGRLLNFFFQDPFVALIPLPKSRNQLDNTDFQRNGSLVGEFNGVAHQIQKDLSEPLVVR